MKLFQFTKLKAIVLSSEELLMANSIIQSTLPFIIHPTAEQKTLSTKIQRAKNAVRKGHYELCSVTESERKAMRDFNLEYCCKLTEIIRSKTINREPISDALQAYQIATTIQLKFRA